MNSEMTCIRKYHNLVRRKVHLIILGVAVLTTSCRGTKFELHRTLDPYAPKIRVGVESISIERSRVIKYFGFKGSRSLPMIDLTTVRGGRRGQRNEIRFRIKQGEIKEYQTTGTKSPKVDQRISDIVKRWSDATGPRFSEFVESVEFIVIVDQGGTFEIHFEEFEVRQPEGEDGFRFFHYISDDHSDLRRLLPIGPKFQLTGVRMADGMKQEFRGLREDLAEWRQRSN